MRNPKKSKTREESRGGSRLGVAIAHRGAKAGLGQKVTPGNAQGT